MTQDRRTTRRRRITRPYPNHTLESALEVADAIQKSNAGLPFDRELLAGALGTTPRSSAFVQRLNAASAYGLTHGGYNDASISITPLGSAIVASDCAGERKRSLIRAAMTPDIFCRFYEMLDGKRLPENTYAQRLLESQLGVHSNLTAECLDLLTDNGVFAGIIRDVGGAFEVWCDELASSDSEPEEPHAVVEQNPKHTESPQSIADSELPAPYGDDLPAADDEGDSGRANRVFVAYAGDAYAAEFAIAMLEGFGIACVLVDVGAAADGMPVPAHALSAMRSANAGILVFPDARQAASDGMLCLLGAAAVLFDNRVAVFHAAGSAAVDGFDALCRVSFAPGRVSDAALGLLGGLHRAGVVSISA